MSNARRQWSIDWRQVLGTSAGAALATLLLSRLGMAGTIVGAAATPIIITLSSAALSRESERAHMGFKRLKRERGPSGFRLMEVGAAAGVSHSVILHHFGSREALLSAVVQRALGTLRDDLLSALATGDGNDGAMRMFVSSGSFRYGNDAPASVTAIRRTSW